MQNSISGLRIKCQFFGVLACVSIVFGLSALILMFWTSNAPAQIIGEEIHGVIQDEEEAETFVKKDWRFLPVPIPISNPTIGTGLALAGLYLHPKKEGDETNRSTISGVAGMYTNTKSWMVGGFHDGSYGGDRYRITGAVAYGEFNLKYYGIGNDSPLRDKPISYEAKAIAVAPRVLFRLPFENWFMGPRYVFLKIDNEFDLSNIHPALPEIRIPTQTSGLGLVAVYDSRNNNLLPSEGSWVEIAGTAFGEYLSGDFDYQKYHVKFAQFFPLAKAVTLAYRIDGQFISGDAPFYDLANLNLRGFEGGFYVDNNAVTAQIQGSWQFYRRWVGLLFGGAGRIAETLGDLGDAKTRWACGAGVRYIVNEEQRLAVGLDITYAEGRTELYVQIGDWLAR
jgi:hypothetical protein